MYHSSGKRRDSGRGVGAVEIVWILLVIVALVALGWFIVAEAGGGALMT
jgi:hypothetical protein